MQHWASCHLLKTVFSVILCLVLVDQLQKWHMLNVSVCVVFWFALSLTEGVYSGWKKVDESRFWMQENINYFFNISAKTRRWNICLLAMIVQLLIVTFGCVLLLQSSACGCLLITFNACLPDLSELFKFKAVSHWDREKVTAYDSFLLILATASTILVSILCCTHLMRTLKSLSRCNFCMCFLFLVLFVFEFYFWLMKTTSVSLQTERFNILCSND